MTALSDRAGSLIFANLIKYAVGFILPMVLVRLLSQEDYGTYQQMILIGTTLLGLMVFGLPTSVYYFYHHVTHSQLGALIMQTTLILLAGGMVAGVGVYFGADLIAARFNNPGMAELLALYAVSIMFMIASEHSMPFLIAQNRYGLAVSFEVGETVIRVATLLLPLALGFGFKGLILGIVVYSTVRFAVRTAILFYNSEVQFADWTKHAFPGEQLGYAIPIALGSLLALIGNTFNRGIVAASFTPRDYAIYAVGALEIPLDVIFQASVANVLRASLPPLVRDGKLEEVVRVVRESMRGLAIIVLPSFIFLYGHAHEFITLLFTNSYAESVDVFRIYLWLVPLHMFILSPIPQVFGRTRINLYVVIVMISTMLILSYALLKWLGFLGPAYAFVISNYVGVVLFFVVALRLTRTTLVKLLPLMAMLRVVIAAAAGYLASVPFLELTRSALLNFGLAALIFSLAFFAVGALIGVFTPADRALIRRWITKFMPGRR